MTSKVVRATELKRVLDVLASRGVEPTTVDLLPGGAIRLHTCTPDAANDAAAERERQAWDEALAG